MSLVVSVKIYLQFQFPVTVGFFSTVIWEFVNSHISPVSKIQVNSLAVSIPYSVTNQILALPLGVVTLILFTGSNIFNFHPLFYDINNHILY